MIQLFLAYGKRKKVHSISKQNYKFHKKSATVLWDFPIQTDRTIKVNRPDITIKDLEEKTCKLLDFTFPMDVNISAKGFENLSKYKLLHIDCS